jgi:hypothetical protein
MALNGLRESKGAAVLGTRAKEEPADDRQSSTAQLGASAAAQLRVVGSATRQSVQGKQRPDSVSSVPITWRHNDGTRQHPAAMCLEAIAFGDV